MTSMSDISDISVLTGTVNIIIDHYKIIAQISNLYFDYIYFKIIFVHD